MKRTLLIDIFLVASITAIIATGFYFRNSWWGEKSLGTCAIIVGSYFIFVLATSHATPLGDIVRTLCSSVFLPRIEEMGYIWGILLIGVGTLVLIL